MIETIKIVPRWKSFPVDSIVFSKRSLHVGGHLCWPNFDAEFYQRLWWWWRCRWWWWWWWWCRWWWWDGSEDDNGDVTMPQIPGTWVRAFVCSMTDDSLNRTDNWCPLLFVNTKIIIILIPTHYPQTIHKLQWVQTQYFSSSKIAVYYYWHCWLKNVLTNLTILQQFGLSWWGLLMLVFLNVKLFIFHWLTDDQSMTSMGFSAAGKSQYLESNSETVGLSWIPSGRQLRPIVYQCHLSSSKEAFRDTQWREVEQMSPLD